MAATTNQGTPTIDAALNSVEIEDIEKLGKVLWREVRRHPRDATCECVAIEAVAQLMHLGYRVERQETAPLAIIGRERALANSLTKLLHNATKTRHNYAPITETPRGTTFRVELLVDKEPTGRTARVTIEMEEPT